MCFKMKSRKTQTMFITLWLSYAIYICCVVSNKQIIVFGCFDGFKRHPGAHKKFNDVFLRFFSWMACVCCSGKHIPHFVFLFIFYDFQPWLEQSNTRKSALRKIHQTWWKGMKSGVVQEWRDGHSYSDGSAWSMSMKMMYRLVSCYGTAFQRNAGFILCNSLQTDIVRCANHKSLYIYHITDINPLNADMMFIFT